jgi:predicted metal-dependent hydrolase
MAATKKKTSVGLLRVEVDGQPITFELLHSRRKTLTLRIHPDLRITVDAPVGTSQSDARNFVSRHARWIARKQAALQQIAPVTAPRQYQNGELFTYLGAKVPLEVELDRIERVRLVAGTLIVGTKTPANQATVRAMIGTWYKRRAEQLYPAVLHTQFTRLQDKLGPGRAEPPLRIRAMKTRWGSCTREGRITLNLALIQMPEALINYVVVHELCHLAEFNHGPRFWALVKSVVPGYRDARKALRDYPAIDFY